MTAILHARAGVVAGLLMVGGLVPWIAASNAEAARACKPIRVGEFRFNVSIERGPVSCGTARHLLRAFLRGEGTLHGPVNGPSYKQTWKLPGGWSCGRGAGGGGCIRGGTDYTSARDYIVAETRY